MITHNFEKHSKMNSNNYEKKMEEKFLNTKNINPLRS